MPLLKVGEVHPVGVQHGLFVAFASGADSFEERIAGGRQPAGIDELFRDLVEVAARALDGGPARLPAVEKQAVFGRADDLVEVIEDEEELGQIVQRFVAVSERCPVPMPGEHPVAEAVDGRDRQLGEVAGMTDLAGRRGQPVAHLEGGLPGEGAEHDVLRLGLSQQQEVQGPQDDAEGLAGPRTRDHQQRPVEVADDRALALGELRVVLRDGGRDVHHGPPLRGRFACGPGVSPADARVLPGRAVPRGRAVPWRMDSWFPESAGTQTQEGPSSAPATHESVRVDIGVLGKASCCPGFVADVKRASCSVSYVEVEAVGQVERELAAPPLREVPPAVTRPSAEIQLSGVPPDRLLPVVMLEAADDLLDGIESISAPAYLHCPAPHVDHRSRGRECCFGEQQW